jgi:putative glutamine amidotransferase
MTKPIIGITLDYQKEGSFSKRPHYAIREGYFSAVIAAGGLPIGIPHEENLIDEYLSKVNALVIPGGDFGLDPDWYIEGEKPAFEASPRLKFDVEIITKALEKNIPLLGICAGMQILACMHGCKMSSKIQNYSSMNRNHLNEVPAENYAHAIFVDKGTTLHKIVGDKMMANSRHTEGVVKLSDKVQLAGKSDDGIIEAIEIPNKKFALGVQWHPEFFADDANADIIRALINEAKNVKTNCGL